MGCRATASQYQLAGRAIPTIPSLCLADDRKRLLTDLPVTDVKLIDLRFRDKLINLDRAFAFERHGPQVPRSPILQRVADIGQ